jgi:hypothetical protein
LLGVLALLCDAANRPNPSSTTEAFTAHFPQLRPRVESFAPRLVVFVSLDDYSAAHFSLEDVFWRELQSEWKRRELGEWNIEREGSRAESLAALEDALRRRKLSGLVVLFDEMSLFLAAREPRELQGDASWLQFLAQHARRDGDCPLHIIAALQKTIEDIGPLEAYSLGQIRDRFQTLPLSLAHLPALVERRLIEVRDETTLDEWCKSSFLLLNEALPRSISGPQEWRALFRLSGHNCLC